MGNTKQEEMARLFECCAQRGWLPERRPSTITEEEVAEFEAWYGYRLPEWYRAFLLTERLPGEGWEFEINGVIDQGDELDILWLMLYRIDKMEMLVEQVENFRSIAPDYGATQEQIRTLLPIGDWGAGWGPLCLDLTVDENAVDVEQENTWSVVWLDHEMEWPPYYLGEDGRLHGSAAAPDFHTLLEWYFCGSLEERFEREEQVKVTYERLNSRGFCSSWWEERWKTGTDRPTSAP